MKILHILNIESEISLAVDLEMMIEKVALATFLTETSAGVAKKALKESIDFAFLDVDVTKDKSFEIAEILDIRNVPYAVISASRQDQLPLELRGAPVIPKPFYVAQIKRALQAVAASDPSQGLRKSLSGSALRSVRVLMSVSLCDLGAAPPIQAACRARRYPYVSHFQPPPKSHRRRLCNPQT